MLPLGQFVMPKRSNPEQMGQLWTPQNSRLNQLRNMPEIKSFTQGQNESGQRTLNTCNEAFIRLHKQTDGQTDGWTI